jgi:hypothetical protein
VVLLADLTPGYFPELSAVRDNVQRDYLSERQQRALTEITQTIRERYTIDIKNLQTEPQ